MLSLILMTTLYVVMINFEHEESIKQNLKSNNETFIRLINSGAVTDMESYFTGFQNSNIRMTLIDSNGIVVKKSDALPYDLDNHSSRKEIEDAKRYGNGYSVRYSETLEKAMLYYATSFDNKYIIRSSMPMELLAGFEKEYIKYYVIIVFIVILISVMFSHKLSGNIVKPIKNLEFITSKIAKGEYDRRLRIKSQDEIGNLANTFNHMADRLQHTLRDSMEKHNKLEAILKSMDSGVIAVDKNYRVIMINPYAMKIFGIDKDIIGNNLMNSVRDYELEDIFKNTDDSKEITILWPEKRSLKIKTADIMNDSRHIGTVAVVQDITDIKRLENMRSQFVANVSHELKTPLTSIKGFAETLKYVDNKETKDKFLSIIDDEVNRLTRLISDILTLSDIEKQKNFTIIEDINVKKVLESIYHLMKNTADKKRVHLSSACSDNIILSGDNDKFKQMLINLIDNAIKYSDEGDSVFVEAKIEESLCVITIEDTGAGIPKKHIPRLFERFYRVDKARSRARGGTGLGLAIVKHIVLSFKAEIFVESEVGKGTKFTVKLPLER